MRIALVADPHSEHVQRWFVELLSRGHQCRIFAPASDASPLVEFEPIGVVGRRGPLGLVTRVLDLRHKLRAYAPDVVHAHYAVDYGTWAALSGVRPFVLSLWGSDIYLLSGQSWLTRAKARRALKSADLITADSEDLMREAERWGADRSKLVHLVFGVDTQVIKPGVKEATTPLVLSTRRLHDIYRIQDILDAAEGAAAKGVEFELIVAGHGPCIDQLRSSDSALRLGERLKFTGYLERQEIERLYGLAKVYVSVPESDATAVSLLEAMSGGAAVIASDLPSAREWLSEEDGNRFVKPRDVNALASALIELLQDESLRERASRANRKAAVERADWSREVDRMEAIYRRLVEAR